jgi:hypothetical protein
LHLGSFPTAEPAALAYDRAAKKLRPWNTHLNFPDTDYSQDEFMRVTQSLMIILTLVTTAIKLAVKTPIHQAYHLTS